MNTKNFTLFSHKENNIQTYIQCKITENASFYTKGNIIHIKIKSNVPNNQKRRDRYKLNKERKIRLLKELEEERLTQEKEQEKIEETKKTHKNYDNHILKLQAIQEIDMDSELEDMESYI